MGTKAKKRVILIVIAVVALAALAAGLALFLTAGDGSANQGKSSQTGSANKAGASSNPSTTTKTSATTTKSNTAGANTGQAASSGSTGSDSGQPGGSPGSSGSSGSNSGGGGSGPATPQPAPQPQPQTAKLKPGNVFFYVHQGNEFHNLVTGAPVEFMVNIQLWVPGNNNEIITIDQATSVWVEYWKLPAGTKQSVQLVHIKNDQGHAWWSASIPALNSDDYQAVAYASTSQNTVAVSATFTIN